MPAPSDGTTTARPSTWNSYTFARSRSSASSTVPPGRGRAATSTSVRTAFPSNASRWRAYSASLPAIHERVRSAATSPKTMAARRTNFCFMAGAIRGMPGA